MEKLDIVYVLSSKTIWHYVQAELASREYIKHLFPSSIPSFHRIYGASQSVRAKFTPINTPVNTLAGQISKRAMN